MKGIPGGRCCDYAGQLRGVSHRRLHRDIKMGRPGGRWGCEAMADTLWKELGRKKRPIVIRESVGNKANRLGGKPEGKKALGRSHCAKKKVPLQKGYTTIIAFRGGGVRDRIRTLNTVTKRGCFVGLRWGIWSLLKGKTWLGLLTTTLILGKRLNKGGEGHRKEKRIYTRSLRRGGGPGGKKLLK